MGVHCSYRGDAHSSLKSGDGRPYGVRLLGIRVGGVCALVDTRGGYRAWGGAACSSKSRSVACAGRAGIAREQSAHDWGSSEEAVASIGITRGAIG
jgi:hypothetical protein